MTTIDWKLWIPPSELPKEFKRYCRGQIIGFAAELESDIRAVCEVIEDTTLERAIKVRVLAVVSSWWGQDGHGAIGQGSHSRKTILIQDVGQSEPTDPDLLYQFLYK